MSSGDGCEADAEGERYSHGQICALIEAMRDADVDAVVKASLYFADRVGMEPKDLRQEAFARALDSRTCRVGTDIVSFICGIMKSMASEGPRVRKKAREKAEARGGAVQPAGIELAFVDDYESLGGLKADAVSPQDEALSSVFHARELEKAMACISDDDDLLLLVEGIHDGMFGKPLEELLGTDTKGLAALRKKLGRRLAARFPTGVPV